jgi:hypothetical protein
MARQLVTVDCTVDSSGDAVVLTPDISGFIEAMRYVPDGSAPLATGWDAVIVGTTTSMAIITITNGGTSAVEFRPRAATQDITNVASLYESGEAVEDKIFVHGESLTVTLDQGGASKAGKLFIWVS